jgi:hypothetical protein
LYKPPDAPDESLQELESSLQKVTGKYPNANMYLGGDFNLGDIDWKSQSVKHGSNKRLQCDKLIDIMNDFSLHQTIEEPTYRNTSILDLFFTNTPGLILKSYNAPGISENDHDLVIIETVLKGEINKKAPRKVFVFGKANITQIKFDLRALQYKYMDTDPNGRPLDENWKLFKEDLSEIMSKNIPKKIIAQRWNQPWINNAHF